MLQTVEISREDYLELEKLLFDNKLIKEKENIRGNEMEGIHKLILKNNKEIFCERRYYY